MSASIRLGRILGIPIGLHYTWFVVFVLVTGMLATSYFPDAYPGWSNVQYYGIALITSLIFFASIVAHELGHSIVAMRNGIRVKSITLFVFGGVAQISKEADRPRVEFTIAIAGPLVSAALGGLFIGLYFLVRDASDPAAALCFYLGEINLSVAIFNMIPGFPLDGGRVFRSLVWAVRGNFVRATRISAGLGRGIGYLFIIGGLIVVLWRHDLVSGLWIAFIGWFLENAASASYQQVAAREALSGVRVEEIMTPDPPIIPGRVDLRTLVESYIAHTGKRCFIVSDFGEWRGLVSLTDIRRVPRERWAETRVADIMVAKEKVATVRREEDALRAVALMEELDVNQLPVVGGNEIVGLVARDNILRLLQTKKRLGTA
ncbi:MAG: site-2 protease family protein [Dehalococcoidia bacterium]|nr:site-2 protease family protein [Dehalococcoidia bacterium]